MLVVDVRGDKACVRRRDRRGGRAAQACETDVSDPRRWRSWSRTAAETSAARRALQQRRRERARHRGRAVGCGLGADLEHQRVVTLLRSQVRGAGHGRTGRIDRGHRRSRASSRMVASGYAASKAAVIGPDRAAVDHARDGIRANCICPGMTATPPMLSFLRDGPLSEAAADAIPGPARTPRSSRRSQSGWRARSRPS